MRPLSRVIPVGITVVFGLTGPLFSLFAEAPDIGPGDVYIEMDEGAEGFNLFIRAAANLGSVLITESSADPAKRADSFAFRAWDYNPINGDERRILDGEFLESERPLYFLLDSTPEPNALLGSAYHIYVPLQLTYGYPWSREGQIDVHRGTWLNIRAFERPYADYRGEWRDKAFVLSMNELPPPPESELESDPGPGLESEVLAFDEGPVEGIEQAVERITEIIGFSGGNIDVVLAVDTTVSMKDDIGFIKRSLVPLVRSRIAGFDGFRAGLVFYRDYKEAYLTRSSPFTDDLDELQRLLDAATVSGGRDKPEAVNEGIYAALTEFDWAAPERIIIQVGDAPAHDEPRGAITPEMVQDQAARLGVSIHPIRLPGTDDEA